MTYQPLKQQANPGADQIAVSYPRGWNQIGNPYLYAIPLSEIQVDDGTGDIVTLATAGDSLHQWVLPVSFRYNTTSPTASNWTYEMLNNSGDMIAPMEGIWIFVKKGGLTFTFTGTNVSGVDVRLRAAKVSTNLATQSGRSSTNNWKLRLSAQSPSGSDMTNYIGVAPKATDSADYYKIEKPPVVGNQLSLDILHPEWANTGGRYTQDLRSPATTQKTWNILVRSAHPNEEVTLTWPDIAASLPKSVNLKLIDQETKVERSLRNTSSYVINTGANGTRSIQIVAEPGRTSSRVAITNFDVIANADGRAAGPQTVTIHYGLSQAAETRIYVRSGGRTVRTLTATTRAATNGSNTGSTVWDVKDDKGVTLPTGSYVIELEALSADGQRARQTRPYLLTR